MAQEAQADGGANLPRGSQGPARYLILIVLIMLLETAVAYVLLDWAIPAPESVTETVEEAEVAVQKESATPIFFTGLEQVVFAPLDSKHLVQATLALEVDRQAALDELTLRHQEMWDLVLRTMEAAATDDLRDPEKERVKEAVAQALNKTLQNGEVLGVYFVDYIMQ